MKMSTKCFLSQGPPPLAPSIRLLGVRSINPSVFRTIHRARPEWKDETVMDQLEIAVPKDQRPVNQLKELKGGALYSWGCLDQGDYIKRVAILFTGLFFLFGAPISFQTFDPKTTPAEFFLAGNPYFLRSYFSQKRFFFDFHIVLITA